MAFKNIILAIAAGTLLIVTLSFISSQKEKGSMNISYDKYEAAWKEIDSLAEKGLSRSSLEKVEALFLVAKNDENAPQVVKCLFYISRFVSELHDEELVIINDRLLEEIEAAKQPTKSILESILGNIYISYGQDYHYANQNSSDILEDEHIDILEWSRTRFLDEGEKLFLRSISDHQALNVPLEDFNEIIASSNYDHSIYTSLYDLLASRAMEYFLQNYRVANNTLDAPILSDEKLFSTGSSFMALDLDELVEQDKVLVWLRLFQKILQNHANDTDQHAFVFFDLQRLEYLKRFSTNENKNELYLYALNSLDRRYTGTPPIFKIRFQLANFYNKRSARWTPHGDDAYKWDKKQALDIIERTLPIDGLLHDRNTLLRLQHEILSKQLSFKIEEVNLPEEDFRMLVSYRNISAIYTKVIKLGTDEIAKFSEGGHDRSALIKSILAKGAALDFEQALIDDGDFQKHSLEMRIPGLKIGAYAIICSPEPNFETIEKIALEFTQVSNIAFVMSQSGSNTGYALERKNGNSIVNADVLLIEHKYDYKKRKYINYFQKTIKTDKQGAFQIPAQHDRNFSITIMHDKDTLWSDKKLRYHYRETNSKVQKQTYFFTDRAIYRPGQNVYFKGLLITKNELKKPSINPFTKVIIQVLDPNRQPIIKEEYVSNEYGSISGSFTLPDNLLSGRITITSSHSNHSHSIRMEEYKRPTFKVELDPFAEDYKLGDDVQVRGNASSYAGFGIGDAPFQYRVTRELVRPFWMSYYRYAPPTSENVREIAKGEGVSDENGNFIIDFNAAAGANQENLYNRYIFKVHVDLRDQNGETRSATKNYHLSKQSVFFTSNVKNTERLDSIKEINFYAKNISGKPIEAKAKLKIELLSGPSIALRKRLWDRPDKFLYSESQFRAYFPSDIYDNELDKNTWESEQVLLDRFLDFKEDGVVQLQTPISAGGAYKISVLDTASNELLYQQIVTVTESGDLRPNVVDLDLYPLKNSYQPGDDISFDHSTSLKDLNILTFIERRSQPIVPKFYSISEINQLSIDVKETDRGGMAFHYIYVKNNRYYKKYLNLEVPWSNKELEISFLTFRDKIEPGAEEEFIIKISGSKKEMVSAEILASMYDASLDAFVLNRWPQRFYPNFSTRISFNQYGFGIVQSYANLFEGLLIPHANFVQPDFNMFGFFSGGYGLRYHMDLAESPMMETAGMRTPKMMRSNAAPDSFDDAEVEETETKEAAKDEENADFAVRKNLNETVFFQPNLETDKDGNVFLKFKMNEALTSWKLQLFAHSKGFQYAYAEKMVKTEKEIMVFPNIPRFIRAGDQLDLAVKIQNITEDKQFGEAKITLLNALSNEDVTHLFVTKQSEGFNIEPKSAQTIRWGIEVPDNWTAPLTYRIIAKGANKGDGEEGIVPVLTNRMLVHESIPISVKGGETKTLKFNSLLNANESNSLTHHSYAIEFSNNPAWYAVQAMPYLMQYPYDCNEQIMSRLYANMLAGHVTHQLPEIKATFEKWKNTDALLSNLQKNEDLKNALLRETPWVLDATSESARKKQIGLLFDVVKMGQETKDGIDKLIQRQASNGSFSWFPGGRPNRYVTQYIVESFGHLEKLGLRGLDADPKIQSMLKKAISFADEEMYRDFQERTKHLGILDPKQFYLSNLDIQYLYMRSFYPELKMEDDIEKLYNLFISQISDHWTTQGLFQQAMIGLVLQRAGESSISKDILNSLDERAIHHEDLGVYWKQKNGYFWHQHPIETHSIMIEFYNELLPSSDMIDLMRIWLLKNKQTNAWKNSKATAYAVYALLLGGENWLGEKADVTIFIGGNKVNVNDLEKEAGTGYFKKKFDHEEINSQMGNIEVHNPNETMTWGAAHWQYFEDLDKIESFRETPLTLEKEIFIEEISKDGPVLISITDQEPKIGDKLVVRIVLKVDRAMEFIHLRDMRASGLEPLNVLSSYKWQSGLSYYESTKDTSTDFFIDYLPKGTFVFEYGLRAFHSGSFSNGISQIQCMYAPEFSSHAGGLHLEIHGDEE